MQVESTLIGFTKSAHEPHFASQWFPGEEFWRAFFETLFLCRSPQASLLSNAWHDSLAKYASLTTFGHIMALVQVR